MSRRPVLLNELEAYRDLVTRILDGTAPPDDELNMCRATVRAAVAVADRQTAMQALCMLLEGALADPSLSIDDTQVLVPLLKALARGRVEPAQIVAIEGMEQEETVSP